MWWAATRGQSSEGCLRAQKLLHFRQRFPLRSSPVNVSVNVSEALTEKRLKPFSESLGDLSRFGGMIGKSDVGLMLGLQLPIPRSKALFKSITVFELLYTGLHCKRLQCKALNSRVSDLKIRLSSSKKSS